MSNFNCETCTAPKEVKETVGCAADRLHNAKEVFKQGIFQEFGAHYEPKLQCRYADLLQNTEEREKQMDIRELIEQLRNKTSRDNRDLLDTAADALEYLLRVKEGYEQAGSERGANDGQKR